MILLASGSAIRRKLLEDAGVAVEATPARVDEIALKRAMEGEAARDVADALAQAKALKVSIKRPEAMVIGCDQILSHDGRILSKAEDQQELEDQLHRLSGGRHDLISAAVICEEGRPVWRAISTARMHMAPLSAGFIRDYVARNWEDVRHSVGGYMIEREGPRLFHNIEGDYFAVLGLPLLQVLSYLNTRGRLAR